MKKLKNTIPTWLFSSLYNGMKPQRKWNEEKEELSIHIIQKLKDKSEWNYWDKSILEKVLYINQDDNHHMYGVDSVYEKVDGKS